MHTDALTAEEFSKFIELLQAESAEKIGESRLIMDPLKKAIYDYVDLAYGSGLSAEEVVDCFCVSAHSVINRLPHFSADEKEWVVFIFDHLNDAIFPKYFPESR